MDSSIRHCETCQCRLETEESPPNPSNNVEHVTDMEFSGRRDVLAKIVAKNMLDLDRDEFKLHKRAFDDWETTFELFRKRGELKEGQKDVIRTEIYQLIGFFVVFQGVVFTAVAQANVLRCHNWWSSFILSLLASIVVIYAVVQKLASYWALEKTIATEKGSMKVLRRRTETMKAGGPRKFDFNKHAADGGTRDLGKPGLPLFLYMCGVIAVLLAFSVVFLVSCARILCDPGVAPKR